MTKIKFEMIADNRFCEDIGKEIHNLNKKILITILGLTKKFSNTEARLVDFGDGTKQYRITYIVEKDKSFTYNDLYKAINEVKPVLYKIIRPKTIKI